MRNTLKSAVRIPDNEMHLLVPAALLMSFFEAINSTLDSGFEQHIFGAITLLEAKGPEIFANAEFHDLFLAVRGHAVCLTFSCDFFTSNNVQLFNYFRLLSHS